MTACLPAHGRRRRGALRLRRAPDCAAQPMSECSTISPPAIRRIRDLALLMVRAMRGCRRSRPHGKGIVCPSAPSRRTSAAARLTFRTLPVILMFDGRLLRNHQQRGSASLCAAIRPAVGQAKRGVSSGRRKCRWPPRCTCGGRTGSSATVTTGCELVLISAISAPQAKAPVYCFSEAAAVSNCALPEGKQLRR